MKAEPNAVIAALKSNQASAFRLAAYSFLILFFELALIRYLPATVRVFSYYINFVLMATFVGMGAGLLGARHVRWLRWSLPPLCLAILVLTRMFANVLVRVPEDSSEFLWAIYDASPAVKQLGMLPTVSILFAVAAVFFVPLGAMVGEEFRRFPALLAYSIDILGSLSGILVFALISYLGWVPWTWFALGFAVLVVVSLHDRAYAAFTLATAPLALLLVLSAAQPNEVWSPYYRIDWRKNSDGLYTINVNGSMHLTALDVSQRDREAIPWVRGARASYLAPYQSVERVDTVLVMGAGAGNDVALLLDMGARHVDAVEIDPDIAQLGRQLHFQRPYDDSRVEVHITDARAFLKTTRRRYDLIVFGTLDSQTLLSGMSSVRLDNYVYTLEALLSARDRLSDDGRLVMYHMSPRPEIAAKIFQTLTAVFGEPPLVLHWDQHFLFNYAFVSTISDEAPLPHQAVEYVVRFPIIGMPGSATSVEMHTEARVVPYPAELLKAVKIPTDDWPYLYLKGPTFPAHYLQGLAIVLLFSALLVIGAGGRELTGGTDIEMFLLGLGFLLLETKSVTEMSLLFGSTWEVNLLVFSSILLVILLANWIVLAIPRLALRPVLVALLVSLVIGYLVPVRAIAGESVTLEWLLGGLLVASPVFFASLTFAMLFRARRNSVRSLGYNLLGAAVGGVLEYTVMILGVKALYLVAALAYSSVWLSVEKMSSLRNLRQAVTARATPVPPP